MKLASITNSPLLCNCGNHLLGLNGELCDICMGAVYSSDEQELSGSNSRFDAAYFEALEAFQGGIDRAA